MLSKLPLLIGVLALSACRGAPNDEPARPAATPPSAAQPGDTSDMRLTGTVRAVGVEGGCWQFEADDGRKFELARSFAPSALLQDGKKATLVLKARPDLMSTCMVGPIVEVVKVE
jgi:hypothetical protein